MRERLLWYDKVMNSEEGSFEQSLEESLKNFE